MSSRARTAINGAMSTYGVTGLHIVAYIALMPWILDRMGLSHFGFWLFSIEALALAEPLFFGLSQALAFHAASEASPSRLNRMASSYQAMMTWLGLPLLPIAIASSVWAPRILGVDPGIEGRVAIIGVAAAFCLRSPFSTYAMLLFGRGLLHVLNGVQAQATIARVLVLCICLGLGFGYTALAAALIVEAAVSSVGTRSAVDARLPELARPGRREAKWPHYWALVRFGLPISVTSLAVVLIQRVDSLVIGALFEAEQVTVYALSGKATFLTSMLILQGLAALFPLLTQAIADQGTMRLGSTLGLIQRLALLTGCATGLGVLAFNRSFVTCWIGAEAYGGEMLDLALAGWAIYTCSSHAAALTLVALGEPVLVARTRLVEAMLNLPLSIILGGWYGIAGVAAATVVAGLATSGWILPLLITRRISSGWLTRATSALRLLAFGALSAPMLYWISTQTASLTSISQLMPWMAAATIWMALVALFMGLDPSQRRRLLRSVRRG